MQLLLIIIVFFELITYIIIFDVILSWLTLIGLNIRPKFIADIINPLYSNVKKVIPTTIGPFDFTPIVIIILISFIKGAIFIMFPELQSEINNLIN